MKTFFNKLRNTLSQFFYKLGQTKFMLKVKKVLGYIPNYLANKIVYRKRKAIWGIVFVVPVIIGFIYFFLIPFVTTVIYSFSYVYNDEGIHTYSVGFKNYLYVFNEATLSNSSFTELLTSTVIQIISDIPVILIFSLIMAVVLNSKFKGRAFVRAVFFMPVIFNSQAIDMALTSATALQAAMSDSTTDLFNTMFSFNDFLLQANIPVKAVGFLGDASKKIYDIISYSGVQILIFLSAIQSVPKHLYEAAKMEGANQYEMFWKITFPMVSPMMLPAAVYTVVDSFLRTSLIDIIEKFNKPGKELSDKLGELSDYGINAAMSWVYCLVSVVIIAIVLGILSKAVFYYDE